MKIEAVPMLVPRISEGVTFLSDSPNRFSTLTTTVARPLVFVAEHVALIAPFPGPPCAFSGPVSTPPIHKAVTTTVTARRTLTIPLRNAWVLLPHSRAERFLRLVAQLRIVAMPPIKSANCLPTFSHASTENGR